MLHRHAPSACSVRMLYRLHLHPCTPIPFTPIPLHSCTPIPLHPCTPSLLHPRTPAPLHPCTLVHLHSCTPAPLYSSKFLLVLVEQGPEKVSRTRGLRGKNKAFRQMMEIETPRHIESLLRQVKALELLGSHGLWIERCIQQSLHGHCSVTAQSLPSLSLHHECIP